MIEKLKELSKAIKDKERELIALTQDLVILKRNIHDKEMYFEEIVVNNPSLKNDKQRKVFKHNLIREDYDYRELINKQDELNKKIEELKSEVGFLKREFKILTLTAEQLTKEDK